MTALLVAGLGCAVCALGLGVYMLRDYRRRRFEHRRPGYVTDLWKDH